mgnify:CR=1 FL=1
MDNCCNDGLVIRLFKLGIFSDSDSGHYELREDGTTEMREDGTKELRENNN